jgi:hypothetical protein
MSDRVTLLENKINTMEVVLMSHIQAVDLLLPGTAQETIEMVMSQAAVAKKRGDGLAHVLLTSAGNRVGLICDLPGFENPDR